MVMPALAALFACIGESGATSQPSISRPVAPPGRALAIRLGTETAGSGVDAWPAPPVALTAIPLGDGKLSAVPLVGYEDTCTVSFFGGGAQSVGPWIDAANGTWNLEAKAAVVGAIDWPNAADGFTTNGNSRVLTTNDLPANAATGNFPISPSDPAFQYDANPNSIRPQSFAWTVPATPQPVVTPTCTGLGPIGVMTNGVVLFNALDAAGRDAGAHEVQDSCGGHPQQSGVYHYHDVSPCLQPQSTSEAGSSTLVGYALDGYGIYVERDAQGNLPVDADLDACHGRTSTVMWDGGPVTIYHYDATIEYPYVIGCFRGMPVAGGGRSALP